MTARNPNYANQDGSNTGSSGTLESSGTDQVQQSATAVTDQARQAASQVADQAKGAATSQLAARKDQTATGLSAFSSAMHDMGNRLRQNEQTSSFAHYSDQAANQIQRVAGYLQSRDIGQIASEAQDWARRDPVLVVGGAFVLGLVAARFLKASGVQPRATSRGQQGYPGYRRNTGYTPGYRYNDQYYNPYAQRDMNPRYGTTYRPEGRYWNEGVDNEEPRY